MNEDNNNQHTEEQQPSDETQTELRKISKEELKRILEDHKKWLESDGKEGKRADLSRTDLRNANFRYTNLCKANLSYANLRNADFKNANLRNSDLENANLKNANLSGVNFCDAILNGADLSYAFLFETQLFNTKLKETDFSNSEIGYCSFRNVDLTVIKGLNEANHFYVSSIDVDTLYLSKDPIPKSFYRGAGLDENFINYIPSFVNQPIQFYSCFISYANKDYDFAERLYADLQNKGVRCWFAPEKMKIGYEIRNVIDKVIRHHDKLLVIISEYSIESEWVKDEVETAFERERSSKKTFIFPIRIDSAIENTKEAWASKLRRQRNIGDFSNWKKDHNAYKKAFKKLLNDLRFEENDEISY